MRDARIPVRRAGPAFGSALLAAATAARAATWQYAVPFDRGTDRDGKTNAPGRVFLWLPPQAAEVRGLLVAGRLGIEGELVLSPAVRAACADAGIGLIYFDPHVSGVFHYWSEPGLPERFLKAFDDLAARSGRPELRRVPWITAGHSTAGIYCRNVAYWKPDRVAAVVHLKSGNFHQADHVPPSGNLAGIPLLAVNGQIESFGPEGGLRPELGRETQWVFVLRDLQQFRARDPEHLLSLAVHPGEDHFHGGPELDALVACFLRKTAEYRLPALPLPPGDAPLPPRPLRAADGWLSDPDLKAPAHPAAPFAEYAGDRARALWHYDGEMAAAVAGFHRNLGQDQCLENPSCTWLDEGDGWTFRAESRFLDTMPAKFGGAVGGKAVGHAATPIVYRAKPNEPVGQVGPDRFRLLRPLGRKEGVNVAAHSDGDARFRATTRWGSPQVPAVRGAKQAIEFPPVDDLRAGAPPVELRAAASSGLPVHYEVDYGPVEVRDGRLAVSELPAKARFPMECRVTAWQVGRRIAPAVEAAAPVSREFRIASP